jgi:hypothetical protein
MINKFDAASYKKHLPFAVVLDKDENFDNSNKLTLSTKLILVTWQLVGSQPKDKNDKGKPIGTGVIRVSPLPTPIGALPPTDFSMGVFSETFTQFLDLSKIEVEYRLAFKNPKGITRTQVTIQEYIENISYISDSNNSQVIA